MRLILRLIVIGLVVVAQSHGDNFVEIKCDCKNMIFPIGANDITSFTCDVSNTVTIIGNEQIKIEIKANDGRKEVKGFKAENQVIFYLPDEIGKKFRTLEFLQVSSSQLKEITAESLKNVKNLIFLDLSSNDIQFLEANLFQHNSKLQLINLSNNSLYYIDSTAFDGVPDTIQLHLRQNLCYYEFATITRRQDTKNLTRHKACKQITPPNVCSSYSQAAFDTITNLKVILKNQTRLIDNLQSTDTGMSTEATTLDPTTPHTCKIDENKELILIIAAGTITGLLVLIVILQLCSFFCKAKPQNQRIYESAYAQPQPRRNVQTSNQQVQENLENDHMRPQNVQPIANGTNDAVEHAIYSADVENGQVEDFYEEVPRRDDEIYEQNRRDIYAEVKK